MASQAVNEADDRLMQCKLRMVMYFVYRFWNKYGTADSFLYILPCRFVLEYIFYSFSSNHNPPGLPLFQINTCAVTESLICGLWHQRWRHQIQCSNGAITVSILLARMSVDAFYNEQTIQVCKNIFGYINVVPTSWALRFRTKAHGSIQHDKTI